MAGLTSNTPLFQMIDAWAGGLACAVCTVLRGIFGTPQDTEDRKGLLFVKLAEQGSTVLAATAIAEAAKKYGRENVYFLVFEENRFILDTLEIIPPENVLVFKTGSFREIFSSALSRLNDIRELRLRALVDMEFFSKSTAAFAYLTGIPRRVGFHSYHGEGPWRGNLFTHRPRYNPHIHTSETFRSLVAAIETEGSDFPRFNWIPASTPAPLPQIHATAGEDEAMRKLIAANCPTPPTALVLLNANASDLLPLRRWDNDNYISLARRILDLSPNHYVAFTGGPAEAEKTEKITRAVGSNRAFCTAGKTSLRELLALYQLADVLVTNDSGPAHFAALTDIDTVVLFGPETPSLFGALSPRTHAITAGLACSPCVSALNGRQTSCKNNVCMQSISVETVFQAVCIALENRQSKPLRERLTTLFSKG